MRRLVFPVVLAALAVVAQFALARHNPSSVPALSESAFAALGGFRSIAAEVVWFRADRLQEEGRYVELAQLAHTLTLMEPHTPEVWAYAAWNLAYNVSVMMPSADDRWRWVYAGIALLRDDGLRLNPREGDLYRELAWLFELKLGTDLDSAAPTYRRHWKTLVETAKRTGDWASLGMDPVHMARVEQATGFDDWTDPQLSAIYWASRGLLTARDAKTRSLLRMIIRQAQVIYGKNHQT